MNRWLGPFFLLAASSAALAQVAPPKTGTWKTTMEEGKADALKRNVPMLVYVGYKGPAGELQTSSFEDPTVQRLAGRFSCVFLARDYDLAKFQSSYAPWICADVDMKHRPPVLSIGTAKGGPRADLRVEGVGLDAGELAAHLEKALAILAPAELQKARLEMLEQAKLVDVLRKLEGSLGTLEASLAESSSAKFKEELAWAVVVAKSVESKVAKEIQDKDGKKKASGLVSDLKKHLSAMEKFKGKESDGPKGPLLKAQESLNALLDVLPADTRREPPDASAPIATDDALEKSKEPLVQKALKLEADGAAATECGAAWAAASGKGARAMRAAAVAKSTKWYVQAWGAASQDERINLRPSMVTLAGVPASALEPPKGPGAAPGWDWWGPCATDGTFWRSGKSSAKVTPSKGMTPDGRSGVSCATFPVTVGTEYEASVWVFPFGTDAALSFDFLYFDAGGGISGMGATVPVPKDEPWWHKLGLKVTIPSGVIRGRVVVGGTFSSGVVWVDDAQVTEGGKPLSLKNAGFEER